MDPAAHAAGVVGEHAADAGDLGARRVRADAAAVRDQAPVHAPQDGAGLHPHARPAVLDRDGFEVAPAVQQDAVGLGLAVEARATGAEHERRAGGPRDGHHRRRPARCCAGSRPRAGSSGSSSRRRRSGSGPRRARRAPRRRPRPSARRRARGRALRDPVWRGVGSAGAARASPRAARARSARRRPACPPLVRGAPSWGARPPRSLQPHATGAGHLHQPRPVLRGDRLTQGVDQLLGALEPRARGRRRPRATAATSRPGRSRPGSPLSCSNSANHLRIMYSSLRSTRKVTGSL